MLLVTAGTACTVMGIRWDLRLRCNDATATADGEVAWVIVIVRDGQTISTINNTAANNLYEPEQDVVAFGWGTTVDIDSDTRTAWVGTTKSMRKLKIGDTMVFAVLGTANNSSRIKGTIQLFCKF